MIRTCIAVVDASRARLFTFERSHDAGEIREALSEQHDLINPARRQRPSELFTETGPPLGHTGTLQYGTDDHRAKHLRELDREFSCAVIRAVTELLRALPAERLIICASPRMLGELREAGRELRRGTLTIDEVPRDLVKLTDHQLRDQLASYGLLPPIRLPS